MSRELVLNLKAEYFNEIVSGNKPFEFRERNEYWRKRIEGREYDIVTFCLGYPRKDDHKRRHTVIYSGYELQTITHKHFGVVGMDVYAIRTEGSYCRPMKQENEHA
jgi:hypothetical protein